MGTVPGRIGVGASSAVMSVSVAEQCVPAKPGWWTGMLREVGGPCIAQKKWGTGCRESVPRERPARWTGLAAAYTRRRRRSTASAARPKPASTPEPGSGITSVKSSTTNAWPPLVAYALSMATSART